MRYKSKSEHYPREVKKRLSIQETQLSAEQKLQKLEKATGLRLLDIEELELTADEGTDKREKDITTDKHWDEKMSNDIEAQKLFEVIFTI